MYSNKDLFSLDSRRQDNEMGAAGRCRRVGRNDEDLMGVMVAAGRVISRSNLGQRMRRGSKAQMSAPSITTSLIAMNEDEAELDDIGWMRS